MRTAAGLIAAMLVTGCSHINSGQIDYRVADRPGASGSAANCTSKDFGCLSRRYRPSGDERDAPFEAKDVYQIDIQQAMIGSYLPEGVFLGRQFGKSAEIAILANVFEFGADDTEAAQRRFLESGEYDAAGKDPSDVELKLIYYSDDVRFRQPLNFSNLPLKARGIYGGGSIGIQIVVIEVDAQSSPVTSLLTTLARFGQKNIPFNSEVSDILFDLGESLFAGSGSGDDRLFDYRFVLSAAGADPTEVKPTFAPGQYVLRRGENRVAAQDWEGVQLDPNTGRLMKGGAEMREEFYMTLQIQKFAPGTKSEAYAHQGWSAMRSALQRQVDDRDKPLNEVTKAVQASLEERRSADWRGQLSTKWAAAEGRLRVYRNRRFKQIDVDPDTCPGVTRIALDRAADLAELQARDALRDFVAEYQRATKIAEGASASEFAASDHAPLMAYVARYFMPWEGEAEAQFADAASFQAFAKDATEGSYRLR